MTADLDARADAFVLGLLDERTETELDQAISHDRDWAIAVARARDRLLPLDLTATELPGASRLWDKIAAGLKQPQRQPAANIPSPPRRLVPLGLVAAAGLLAGAVLGGRWFTPEPLVIAVLMDNSGAATAVVEDFGGANARIRFVDDVTVPQDRQMQVWTLPSAELGPVSMGLLTAARGTALDAPSLPTPTAGQLYEITLEPLGGSPTGRPTGTILAKGLAAPQSKG